MKENPTTLTHAPQSTEEAGRGAHVLARIARNVLWLFQSSVVSRVLGLAQSIVLARLLVPKDFGIFGLASSMIGFTLIFGDVGIGPSLLYPKEITDDDKSTAFWLNISMASILIVVVIAIAPFVARIYHQPALDRVLIVLSCAFWFQVVAVVHHNLLKRDLRFRALAIIEVAVGVVSLLSAVFLAWRGWGVWAFVLSILATNAANFALLWRASGWTPAWRISRQSARDVGSFSGWYLAAAIASYFAFSLDRLLIGKFMGIDSVGRYSFAYDLALASVAVMSAPLMQVVIPEFATLRFEPAHFWDAYIRVSGYAATVMAPICFAAILAAPALVPAVFGAKWAPSVLPFQIVVVYILIRTVVGDACGSWGRYDLTFRLAVGALVVGGLAIFIGLRHGIVGVAVAICVVGSATYLAGLYMIGSGSAVVRMFRNTGAPMLVAAAVAAVIDLSGKFIPPFSGFAPLLRVLCEVALYLLCYAFFLRRRLTGLLGLLLQRPIPIAIADVGYPEC